MCGQPKGRKGNSHVSKAKLPFGPNSGVVCGTEGCVRPGLVWLKLEEDKSYAKGERVFGYFSDGFGQPAKVRVI